MPRSSDDSSAAPATSADDRLLDEVVRRLVDEFQPRAIYLFGSRARGDAHPESDYDAVVLLDVPDAGSHADQVLAVHALRGLGKPVDAIVMSTDYFEWLSGAVASLPATVKREGRLIYGA